MYWSNLGMKAVVNLNTTRPMRSAMLIASLVAFEYMYHSSCSHKPVLWRTGLLQAIYVKQMQQYNDNHPLSI